MLGNADEPEWCAVIGWSVDCQRDGTPAMKLESYVYTKRQQRATEHNTELEKGKRIMHQQPESIMMMVS